MGEGKGLRIVYMGTPDFAVGALKSLHEALYNIVAVVTMPDKPAGRGLKLKSSPVKDYALENNLKLLQPESLKDELFLEALSALKPDLGIVVAFKMLPKVIWSLPRLGTFNLHASLLPQYRGAAPINRAIMNGDKFTGVTTFMLDANMDTGDIILKRTVDILDNETAGELHDKLMDIGCGAVLESVDRIALGLDGFTAQVNMIVEPLNPAPKIFRADCLIDWSDSIDHIFNQIRGLSPYPGAVTVIKDTEIKIFSAEKEYCNEDIPYGEPFTDLKSYLKISCKGGYIVIKELQAAGKKRMDVASFLRGNSSIWASNINQNCLLKT